MPPNDRLRLRPVKAAIVSEISEATAAAPVPPQERVNFHIGNPVQDDRLTTRMFRIALGLRGQTATDGTPPAQQAAEELGILDGRKEDLEFLLRLVRISAPYMPRGGYLRTNPHDLIRRIHSWLCKDQPDPLAYDLGEKSGVREIILATGGIVETFRVFLHALVNFLEDPPALFFQFGLRLPSHLRLFPEIRFHDLPDDEQPALLALREALRAVPDRPAFLALGRITREETRRHLRQLCGEFPLVVIETNDAPNSASLAREARMSGRVLRFLTPAVLAPRLGGLPTVIVAGPPDLVQIIDVAHFQLKGTPSAPEIEHLALLLSSDRDENTRPGTLLPPAADEPTTEDAGPSAILAPHTRAIEQRLTALTNILEEKTASLTLRATHITESIVQSGIQRLVTTAPPFDPFAETTFEDLCNRLRVEGGQPGFQHDLAQAFLAAFLQHHPEYRYDSSFAISGSSRTALGLLGFHCGIEEVIIPDLSWTYEHCFPRVTAVPLTPAFQIDVDGIIRTVREKIEKDDGWPIRGAVALNNPHNATGQAFPAEAMRSLVQWLLEHDILVIDDLAYQHVAPSSTLGGPPTLRQIANSLVQTGSLSSTQGENVISVHSVSKTDCLAGSRIAVVEIRRPDLRSRFSDINATVAPNVAALFLSYLFYRAPASEVNGYWLLRNRIFDERMSALEEAAQNLPAERNRFAITIRRPTGSMYPLMTIGALPSGVSLDWLSSGLARQGIGLLPLSAFARTEDGFEAGRKSFRLTLGGTDGAEQLLPKTRRVLIDLNRMMAEEESRYSRHTFAPRVHPLHRLFDARPLLARAENLLAGVQRESERLTGEAASSPPADIPDSERARFLQEYLPDRLSMLRKRTGDRVGLASAAVGSIVADEGRALAERLNEELYRDSLAGRKERFRKRLFDRTVHPTQMYSIQVEKIWDEILSSLLRGRDPRPGSERRLGSELLREFAGLNVNIPAKDEGEELLLDLDALLAAEQILREDAVISPPLLLSYWGDWDGSTRPSGQGHQLIATVLIENVRRLASLFQTLRGVAPGTPFEESLVEAVTRLEVSIRSFRRLLDEITFLTHHLEHRYRGILPFQLTPGPARKLGMRLGLARDPLTSLWQHNDRLERRMLGLRQKRKEALEYYFGLNKRLRKALHAAIPAIRSRCGSGTLALEAGLYRDLLKRIVITPRIHQKLITAQDQFAIDTTVHNITEINDIAGASGNPGMILGLQVSMSTSPDALIALDRKLRSRREEILRAHPATDLAPVWVIPLFEDLDAIRAIGSYLGKIWEYAVQSRRIDQEPSSRLEEILPEIFFAGSDLNQQVGQTAGTSLYREAKQEIMSWLAQRGLVGHIRIKLGSGEPMQRQGGYYAPQSGLRAFDTSGENRQRLAAALPASAKRSVEYATTPLMGVFSAGDLRTFQSNLAEQLRSLPALEYARFLFHVHASQRFTEHELARAAEPLFDTRLQFSARGTQELERLTGATHDPVFQEFAKQTTENFRHIIYGTADDVVGLHIISYFIARSTPPLRDRPTYRPGRGVAETRGHRILEKIAETIPLSQYGSLLRAIAHNQAQTAVLGVNQLTTGLFRSLRMFASNQFPEGTGESLLADRVLPKLPVYEILHTLRMYHDPELSHLKALELAFPAGNSALSALREDLDAVARSLGPLRKELVRRHGVTVSHFFDGDRFIPNLLPTIRPDLTVLLQEDLFNTELSLLLAHVSGPVSKSWSTEVRRLLGVPPDIRRWRSAAWNLLGKPVFDRVQSFVELAIALSSLTDPTTLRSQLMPPTLSKPARFRSRIAGGETIDDSMGQFLSAAVEYLGNLSQQHLEVPTTVVRALKEVEHIIKIEEQALSPKQQDELRFYLLQIARLAGENG